MEPLSDYAQLQLHFVDSVQRRHEVIRPIVLLGDRTVAQRAEETQLHPETVRDLTRAGTRACWGLACADSNRHPKAGQGGPRSRGGGTA